MRNQGGWGCRTALIPRTMPSKCRRQVPLPHSGGQCRGQRGPQSVTACLLGDISGLPLVRARTCFPSDSVTNPEAVLCRCCPIQGGRVRAGNGGESALGDACELKSIQKSWGWAVLARGGKWPAQCLSGQSCQQLCDCGNGNCLDLHPSRCWNSTACRAAAGWDFLPDVGFAAVAAGPSCSSAAWAAC